MRMNRAATLYLLSSILLCSAIFIEALHAPSIDNHLIPYLDKMAHAAAFGLLTFLCFQFVRSAGFTVHWPGALAIVLLIIAFGVMDEWMQSFIPGRISCLGDGLSDVAGAGIVAFLYFINKK